MGLPLKDISSRLFGVYSVLNYNPSSGLWTCVCKCGRRIALPLASIEKHGRARNPKCNCARRIYDVTPMEDRFWKFVSVGDGCWEWTGGLHSGYGAIVYPRSRKYEPAHRFSWILHNGPIADRSLFVCHRCDNRRCVRPDHLFLGTPRDNALDMCAKGRNARGERSRSAKMTESSVRLARELRKAGVQIFPLARYFGMSRLNMKRLLRGQTWAHVS